MSKLARRVNREHEIFQHVLGAARVDPTSGIIDYSLGSDTRLQVNFETETMPGKMGAILSGYNAFGDIRYDKITVRGLESTTLDELLFEGTNNGDPKQHTNTIDFYDQAEVLRLMTKIVIKQRQ